MRTNKIILIIALSGMLSMNSEPVNGDTSLRENLTAIGIIAAGVVIAVNYDTIVDNIMNWFYPAPQSEDDMKITSYHEAGHALLAKCLGINVDEVFLG